MRPTSSYDPGPKAEAAAMGGRQNATLPTAPPPPGSLPPAAESRPQPPVYRFLVASFVAQSILNLLCDLLRFGSTSSHNRKACTGFSTHVFVKRRSNRRYRQAAGAAAAQPAARCPLALLAPRLPPR